MIRLAGKSRPKKEIGVKYTKIKAVQNNLIPDKCGKKFSDSL